MGDMELGTCCGCGTLEGVRNILMLHQKSPMPGRGWGCMQCDLPFAGATAVVCDHCLEQPLKFACAGDDWKGRVPIGTLKGYHLHDLTKHTEMHDDPEYLHSQLQWFKESPDAGHPLCLCSFCGKQIVEHDDADECEATMPIRMWDGTNREMRFHASPCFEMLVSLGALMPSKASV